MVVKIIGLLMLGLAIAVFSASLSTFFVWFGWNHGVARAFASTNEISLWQAFSLSLFISSVGGMFKSNLTVNSQD